MDQIMEFFGKSKDVEDKVYKICLRLAKDYPNEWNKEGNMWHGPFLGGYTSLLDTKHGVVSIHLRGANGIVCFFFRDVSEIEDTIYMGQGKDRETELLKQAQEEERETAEKEEKEKKEEQEERNNKSFFAQWVRNVDIEEEIKIKRSLAELCREAAVKLGLLKGHSSSG